jgi:hypothetical protein
MKIRNEYEEAGTAEKFYQEKGALYRNPQERDVRKMLSRFLKAEEIVNVLDLAAGSGEVTLEVVKMGGTSSGFDPYCYEAFETRTGQKCQKWSFEDIAHGVVPEPKVPYSSVICCFALHLLPESFLPAFLAMLNSWTEVLIILTPHKRPHLKEHWGWELIDGKSF